MQISRVQGSEVQGFRGSGVEQRTAEPQNIEEWFRFAQSFL
jgi:hypothetical protein